MRLHRSAFFCLLILATASLPASIKAAVFGTTQERTTFPAVVDGKTYRLQAMLYRPEGNTPRPLVIMSHGRNGKDSPYDPRTVEGYSEICTELARRGYVVAFIVRRGYGDSEGPDTELQPTAIASGLEAAKDYKAAVAYWSTKDFVLPDKIILMGQSQGGWAVLTCTTVSVPGVLGVVNISGGTNFGLMADSNFNYNHWVTACSQLGPLAKVPSLWIYSENDQSIPGATARRMYSAFVAGGADATMKMLPAYGSNGHGIVGAPSLFFDDILAFFKRLDVEVAPAEAVAISAQSGPMSAQIGSSVTLSATVSGNPAPSLHWTKDGVILVESEHFSGVSTATLTISGVTENDGGNYVLTGMNSSGRTQSSAIVITPRGAIPQVNISKGDPTTHIINLSTRGIVATGENVLIAGFIVSGTGAKKILVVASGAGLKKYGITGEISRPVVTLHQNVNGQDVILAQNSDWQTNSTEVLATAAAVGAQIPAASSDPAHGDAALVITVQPGAYTAVVAPASSSATTNGIGLIELFDATPDSPSYLTNISSRGLVEGGERQMIVGVITRGTGPSRLLIRAVGPTLTRFGLKGVVSDTTQKLYANSLGDTPIGANDDWWYSGQSEQLAQLMPEVGLFPFDANSADSAILQQLAPGAYTSVVGKKSTSSGVALVEIYDLN